MKLEDILKNAKQGVLDTVNESKFDFEFDEETLFEGVELPPETKAVIKESLELLAKSGVKAISEQVATSVVESLEADFEAFQEEVVLEAKEKVVENLEFLVNKTSTEWLELNEEAVANRTKAGLYESLLEDVSITLVNHNVELEDSKVDVYDQMVKESEETKAFANSLADENKILREENDALQRKEVMARLTEGMADTSKEKFESLVEGMATDKLIEKGESLVSVFAPKEVNVKIDPTIIKEAKGEDDKGVENKQSQKIKSKTLIIG